MTKLGKPIVRETDAFERTAALIVELHPKYLAIRLKGHRDVVEVDYKAILDLGRKIAWRSEANARPKARSRNATG